MYQSRVGELYRPFTLWPQVKHASVGRGQWPSCGGPRPLTPVSVTVGIQRAWRQPFHILDGLLHSLATKRVSMLHFEKH
jgi:hypothetical protein